MGSAVACIFMDKAAHDVQSTMTMAMDADGSNPVSNKGEVHAGFARW
jgi:hypothetical protein